MRTAVVSGAAGGIGRATVATLRVAGFRVFGVDIIEGEPDDHQHLLADVTDPRSVRDVIRHVVDKAGALNVLVNGAGVSIPGELASLDMRDLERQFAVNVKGSFLLAREAVVHMSNDSRIVNVASELAYVGRAGMSAYCASKGAVLAMTRAWARELAPKILVNAVAPGPTDTPLLAFNAMTASEQAVELQNPLGRIGRADEIARAILFLAASETGFITGQCISVDGGAAMH